MRVYELGDIIDFSVKYDPAILKIFVGSYLCPRESRSTVLGLLGTSWIILLLLCLDGLSSSLGRFLFLVHLGQRLGYVIVLIVFLGSLLGLLLRRLLLGCLKLRNWLLRCSGRRLLQVLRLRYDDWLL